MKMKREPDNKNGKDMIKILLFADHKSKLLYDYYDPERIKDIDLIISCGDLPQEYLSFLSRSAMSPCFI